MKILIFVLLSILSIDCSADIDGCKKMSKRNSDLAIPKVRQAFIDGHRFPIEKVNISRGMDCGDSIYFVFEAKPPYMNFGSHWIVTMYKASGKTEIEDGI